MGEQELITERKQNDSKLAGDRETIVNASIDMQKGKTMKVKWVARRIRKWKSINESI